MYLNNVTLTGYLGGDAECRTTESNITYTVLSLATKTSWKDCATGEWASRTDWHRAVVFGRLAEFAAALLKGDYVQIQGQLRTREYAKPAGEDTPSAKQRTSEIRARSILKLERKRQAAAGDAEPREVPS